MIGTQFKISGTDAQFKAMTEMCEGMEELFAVTLARRIEGMKAEESFVFIKEWFRSVRQMAQAQWIQSGIQASCHPIGQDPAKQ